MRKPGIYEEAEPNSNHKNKPDKRDAVVRKFLMDFAAIPEEVHFDWREDHLQLLLPAVAEALPVLRKNLKILRE